MSSAKFSGRGYITLADVDDLDTRVGALESTVGSIDAQISGSSDLMYYTPSGGAAQPLSMTQTAIEAAFYPLDVATKTMITHTFAAPFIEAPVVTCTIDNNGAGNAMYVANIVSVTAKQVQIYPKYFWGTTGQTTGEGIHIIAVGKTSA